MIIYRIMLCMVCIMAVGVMSLPNVFSQEDFEAIASDEAGLDDTANNTMEDVTMEPAIIEGSGEIVSVNPEASTVTVKILRDGNEGAYEEAQLLIDDNTMISSEDSSLAIFDLKPGNKVTVVYESVSENKNIAKSIMVR